MQMGTKIRNLRKAKNISQETLAGALGVTFQAVSKWENDIAMPDTALIPAIAYYFGVSTDELFDYNVYEIERKVGEIVDEYSRYYDSDRARAEAVLREGLKLYPGNDVLLNCLVGTIPIPERSGEVIELCKALIGTTRLDEVKYDAYRILAEAYESVGEPELAREAIERIPEFYFTKLEVAAKLLTGEESFRAAARQKSLSLGGLVDMLERLADYYEHRDAARAAQQLAIAERVIEAFRGDEATAYTRAPYAAWAETLARVKARREGLEK